MNSKEKVVLQKGKVEGYCLFNLNEEIFFKEEASFYPNKVLGIIFSFNARIENFLCSLCVEVKKIEDLFFIHLNKDFIELELEIVKFDNPNNYCFPFLEGKAGVILYNSAKKQGLLFLD